MKTKVNLTKLAKKDLYLVGSAGNMDSLKSLIKSKLFWAEVNTTESSIFESRLGTVYEVGNRNGVVSDLVIIDGGRRCSLYRIK